MKVSEQPTTALDALPVLNALPGCHLILLPDAPRFTVVGATDAYLAATYLQREAAIGRGVFETNTDDPANAGATGVANLLASLAFVLEHKQAHRMANQRYDIRNPATGGFEYRAWSPLNKPVLDGQGQVRYIIHTVEDVTERVRLLEEGERAARKLQESESLFRSMVEQVPVALMLSRGEDVVIESVNAPMLRFMNKETPDEVLGKKMVEALPELAGQPALQRVVTVQKTGVSFRGDEQPVDLFVNGKLEQRYFNFAYMPVVEAGAEAAVLHVAIDVTQQVLLRREADKAKAEVERQKRFYETITGTTPDLVYMFDLAYRFTYANKALLAMWGTTWESSKGKGLRDLGYEEWHAQLHEREIDEVVATRQPIRGTVSFPHATLGRRIYDYIFAPVFNEGGAVEAVAGTTRDITELKMAEESMKESEQLFRTLANDTPAFMFMADANTNIEFVNKQWLRFAGLDSDEGFGKG